MNSVVNANTGFSTSFNLESFYNYLFRSNIPIVFCVVRSNGNSTDRIFEYYGSPRQNPGNIIRIAANNSFFDLDLAARALRASPLNFIKVILIFGTYTNGGRSAILPPNTIVAGYYDFEGEIAPATYDNIFAPRSNIEMNSCVLANINFVAHTTFISQSNFSICNCTFNTGGRGVVNRQPVIFNINVTSPLLNYIHNTQIDTVNSTPFVYTNTGNTAGHIYIFNSRIQLNSTSIPLFAPAEGNRRSIEIDMVNSITNTGILISRPMSLAVENLQEVESNIARWVNNIIDPSDNNYLTLPLDEQEDITNFIVNAILLRDAKINIGKFRAIVAYNDQAELIIKK